MCTFGTRALSEGPCGELDASRRGLCGITGASPCADCIGYPITAPGAENTEVTRDTMSAL